MISTSGLHGRDPLSLKEIWVSQCCTGRRSRLSSLTRSFACWSNVLYLIFSLFPLHSICHVTSTLIFLKQNAVRIFCLQTHLQHAVWTCRLFVGTFTHSQRCSGLQSQNQLESFKHFNCVALINLDTAFPPLFASIPWPAWFYQPPLVQSELCKTQPKRTLPF